MWSGEIKDGANGLVQRACFWPWDGVGFLSTRGADHARGAKGESALVTQGPLVKLARAHRILDLHCDQRVAA